MPTVKKTHWFAKKPQNLNSRLQSNPSTKKEKKVDVYFILFFFVFLTDPNETTRQVCRECSVRSEI